MSKKVNRLAESTSPYLLQHAHNPVNWYPWGPEALAKAVDEDKPILVSIGYSACHWCHVMERECFEVTAIAEVMNQHFINIKVDREERPDVDQLYMDAVQALGQQGGWPLNVFLTPDQKPFFGGTYFPPSRWVQVLKSIATAYKDRKEEVISSANDLTQALKGDVLGRLTDAKGAVRQNLLQEGIQNLIRQFDLQLGGLKRAPKFPMPAIWQMVSDHGALGNTPEVKTHLQRTLQKIAFGGIYDHIGGGFCRYSVDPAWRVPHFEKMLYDNGQLLSIYANAYLLLEDQELLSPIEETCAWLKREMQAPEGGFYAALDADSEGEEGKFYVWYHQEWQDVLGSEATRAGDYFNVIFPGNWEEGKNIPYRGKTTRQWADTWEMTPEMVQSWATRLKSTLLEARSTRVRPGLDDKIISGWNGMAIKGLVDAYHATENPLALQMAIRCGDFISKEMIKEGKLYRTWKNGKAAIPGFLEDYAHVISGFIALYETSFHEYWLELASQLTENCFKLFHDPKSGFFEFSGHHHDPLIAGKKEIFDNVIPSSNAIMAHNLYYLGRAMEKEEWVRTAEKMLEKVLPSFGTEPGFLSCWGSLGYRMHSPSPEIAISGPESLEWAKAIKKVYIPGRVICASESESGLPLLRDRTPENGKTLIYICYNNTCQRPTTSIEEALKQIHSR